MGQRFNPVQDALNQILPWARGWVLLLSGNG
jgi:hypothetical protein